MRRELLHDIALKALSVAIAVALWLAISGEKTAERSLTVPMELRNFPRDLELTTDLVSSVQVRIRATPGIIHSLEAGEISAQVDLAGVREGERIIQLVPEDVRAPFGVRVVKVTPATLTMMFEKTIEVDVPIRPRLTGEPAVGYEVAEVRSVPPTMRLSGPESRVLAITEAFTEPVSVNGANSDVVETVGVGVGDPTVRILGASRTRVSVAVRQCEARRILEDLPVSVRNGAAEARPAKVRVVVAGPEAMLNRLVPADVRPWVAAAAGPRARVAVELAPGFTGVSVVETTPIEVVLRPGKGRN
jgi:YbbR domain-containing protein